MHLDAEQKLDLTGLRAQLWTKHSSVFGSSLLSTSAAPLLRFRQSIALWLHGFAQFDSNLLFVPARQLCQPVDFMWATYRKIEQLSEMSWRSTLRSMEKLWTFGWPDSLLGLHS